MKLLWVVLPVAMVIAAAIAPRAEILGWKP